MTIEISNNEQALLIFRRLMSGSRRFRQFFSDNFVIDAVKKDGKVVDVRIIESPKAVAPIPSSEQILDLENLLKPTCTNYGQLIPKIIDVFCEPLPDRPES